jgi:hypothetical protein
MKTTHDLISTKWILPALMALALVTALLGLTGCSPHPH